MFPAAATAGYKASLKREKRLAVDRSNASTLQRFTFPLCLFVACAFLLGAFCFNRPVNIPDKLIDLARASRHIAVLTGAGVSAESGVPTFRDAQTGLWAEFKPEDLA